MYIEEISVSQSLLNWILVAWIFLPFLIRPFIFKFQLLRNAFPKMQGDLTSQLFHSYVVSCWFFLPFFFFLFSFQSPSVRWILLFLAFGSWGQALINLNLPKYSKKLRRQIRFGVGIISTLILMAALFYLKFEWSNALALQLGTMADDMNLPNYASSVDWSSLVFLISATMISWIQLISDFLYFRFESANDVSQNLGNEKLESPPAAPITIQYFGFLQRLDLLCIAVGFVHLFYQSSLIALDSLSYFFNSSPGI